MDQHRARVHPLHLWHAYHPLTALRLQHPWLFALVSGALVFLVAFAIDLLANGKADHAHVSAAVALGWFAGIGVASKRARTQRRS